MRRILIVEDDEVIAGMIARSLAQWGYEARMVEDFAHVLDTFCAFDPELVLLDISLPLYNGYYWCAEIRKRSPIPIMFLSSRSESMDIVMAMSMGGDDYITKPFSMEVLLAKLQAVLRRSYAGEPEVSWEFRGARFLPGEGYVLYEAERAELTKNEQRILQYLLERKNKIVPREDIMRRLWDSESFIDDNTLTVNINRLRKTLDAIGLTGLITTHKGEGYAIHETPPAIPSEP